MAQDPLIGAELGHFRVERLIAQGGMGLIYQATHNVIGRRAAIKVLSQKYSEDQNMIKRLHREARAVNRIGHPNIVDIFDFGRTEDNREYFVMEYLPGRSLAQLQSDRKRLPWSLAAPVLSQTLDALAAAHDLNIVHRDIKPENILIVPQEDGGILVKVLDFGIAKSVGLGPEGERLTRAGAVMGTPEYIAPEQIRGRDVDGRADLYAVGAILFEMVMGRRPFESDKVIDLLMMHLRDPVPSMEDIPPELGVPRFVPAVVNKAMAKEPEHRYPDARVFARALGLQTSAVAPSDGTRPLPADLWMLDDSPHDAAEMGSPAAAPARGRAPLATQPAASISSAPSMMGVTPTEVLATGALLKRSFLRWLAPSLLLLISGLAIISHLMLRPRPPLQPGVTSNGSGGTAVTKPAVKDREIDLASLSQTVRLLLRTGASNTTPDVRRLSLQGLGELRDGEALPLIMGALKGDPEPSVRSAAALALVSFSDASGIAVLREAREQSDASTKVWINDALMRMGLADGTVGLNDALKSDDKAIRFQAALALAEAGNKVALPALIEIAGAAVLNKQTLIPLLSALARLGHEESYKSLRKALEHGDLVTQLGAAEGLLRMGQDAPVAQLNSLLASDKPVLKLVAAKLLATTGDYSGLASLREAILSKDEQVRRLAADGLGAISDKAALTPLADALEDPSWGVKASAAEALARILSLMPTAQTQRAQDWLMSALANRDWSVRYAAIGATAEMDPELAVNLLGWAFKDKDPRVRLAAVARLERLPAKSAAPLLASALSDTSEEVRGRAALALGRSSDPTAKQALNAVLRDKSHVVRALAAGALLSLGDTSYLKDLHEAVHSKNAALRRSAITALGKWPDPKAEPLLLSSLKDKDASVRFAAANALALRGRKDGVAELQKSIRKGGETQRQALQALTALGMKPTGDLNELATSPSPESRRLAMEQAAGVRGPAALALLKRGARDPEPTVRSEAVGALAVLAATDTAAMEVLRSMARDTHPLVRTRAELALARLTKGKLDMGKVKPVDRANLPPPPSAPDRPDRKKEESGGKALFVDDKKPDELFKHNLARAGAEADRGHFEAALKYLYAAQSNKNAPAVLFELGRVHYKMCLQQGQREEAFAAHHAAAKSFFDKYLARAPHGPLAARAKTYKNDLRTLAKHRTRPKAN